MRLIDADALIAKCGNWYVEEGTEEGFISDLKHLIDLQPTIEPERKTGRWIWNPDGMDWNLGAWCCSECKFKAETWWANDEKYNPLICSGGKFCGNCGARMIGGDGDALD